jgi:hypothetical protein
MTQSSASDVDASTDRGSAARVPPEEARLRQESFQEFMRAAQAANHAARGVQVHGDLVRRPRHAATATVHSFLRHLRSTGIDGVPEPLGVEGDREVLRFIDGAHAREAWFHQHSSEGLQSAARLLRSIHDASQSWGPPVEASWGAPMEDGDDLVYCHGDPGPWNFIWREHEAIALIDWDLLHPGPRASDVAYALRWFVPTRDDEVTLEWHRFPAVPDRRARAQAFLDAYGALPRDFDVAGEVCARIRTTQAWILERADRGEEPYRTWVSQGMIERWEADIDWTAANQSLFR